MSVITIPPNEESKKCFKAFLELRPHLKDEESFTAQILSQQKEGYQIIAVEHDHEIAACLGYRIITTLARGKILYIDDFVTRESFRGRGYGSNLLRHAIATAKEAKCDEIHLDTGYQRHKAHKTYLDHGFQLHCHHLSLIL